MSEPFEVWRRPGATLYRGDCLDVLPTLAEGSADAVVTDPPAGIEFMGAEWDSFRQGRLRAYKAQPGGKITAKGEPGGRLCERLGTLSVSQKANPRCRSCGRYQWSYPGRKCECAAPDWAIDNSARQTFIGWLTVVMGECLRVLKPGGYALVWALPRTSHWTATAVEDAGFEVKEKVYHMFGSGFPKSRGSLKPAAEEWILARRPARRMTPLNVDEARIPTADRYAVPQVDFAVHAGGEVNKIFDRSHGRQSYRSGNVAESHPAGRYPPNVCLSHHEECRPVGTRRVKGSHDGGHPINVSGKRQSGFAMGAQCGRGYADADGTEEVEDWECHPECPVRLLDEQAGERKSGGGDKGNKGGIKGWFGLSGGKEFTHRYEADFGGPSRYFYVAKASRKDRGEGNDHPTCKSTALMRWLVSLVAKPGAVVLDPFAGSASTGVACLRAGREFVGVERDAHYFAIARSRLANAEGPLFAHAEGGAAP